MDGTAEPALRLEKPLKNHNGRLSKLLSRFLTTVIFIVAFSQKSQFDSRDINFDSLIFHTDIQE